LTHCSFFQLQPKLVSLIWQIVLSEKWPDHNEIKLLKQLPLGKLTSSSAPPSKKSYKARGKRRCAARRKSSIEWARVKRKPPESTRR
jgi:hypothetical protein